MKTRIIVSITRISGSRHFDLHRTAFHVGLLLLIGTLVTLPLLGVGVGYLQYSRSLMGKAMAAQGEEMDRHMALSRSYQEELSRIREALDDMERVTNDNGPPEASASGRLLKASAYLEMREREFLTLRDRIDRVEAVLKTKSGEDLSLHQKLAAAAENAAIKHQLLTGIPNGYPVPFKGVTSGFGRRMHPITGSVEKHGGIDLRARMGTPVLITADGVVEYAGEHKKSGLGILLVVRHQYGFSSVYGHLKNILVRPGQVVRKGQQVARSGNSGLSNGPHLHYEVQYICGRLDPQPFMSWEMANFDSLMGKVTKVDWSSIMKLVAFRIQAFPPEGSSEEERKKLQSLNDLGHAPIVELFICLCFFVVMEISEKRSVGNHDSRQSMLPESPLIGIIDANHKAGYDHAFDGEGRMLFKPFADVPNQFPGIDISHHRNEIPCFGKETVKDWRKFLRPLFLMKMTDHFQIHASPDPFISF